MYNILFEASKIKKELKRSGKSYEFKRPKKNAFNEPTTDFDIIGSVLGLYHETNSSIQIKTGDTTQIRNKKVPTILCLYDSITPLKLNSGDILCFNGKTFKLTGILNIQEWNLIADISLEMVDNVI